MGIERGNFSPLPQPGPEKSSSAASDSSEAPGSAQNPYDDISQTMDKLAWNNDWAATLKFLDQESGKIITGLNDEKHSEKVLDQLVGFQNTLRNSTRYQKSPLEVAKIETNIRQLFLQGLPQIEQRLIKSAETRNVIASSLDALTSLASSPLPSEREAAFQAWNSSKDALRQVAANTPNLLYGYDQLIGSFIKSDSEHRLIAIQEVKEFIQGPEETARQGTGLLHNFLFSKEKPLQEAGLEIAKDTLEHYGLDSEDMIKAFRSSDAAREYPRRISMNVSSIVDLEHIEPGISRTLNKEFGIKTFARYSNRMLLQQYRNRDDTSRPFGVVLFPRDDWNGAFNNDIYKLDSLFNQLGDSHEVRIFEAGTKLGVARALVSARRRYGSQHKISFAIIGGHGTKDSIQFGKQGGFWEDKRNSLYTKDLKGKGARRAGEFFEDEPTIILSSCSTGTKKGIGQKLSETLGATVIAPQVPTAMRNISVARDTDGKLHFDVTYEDKGSRKNYSRGTMV